MKAKALNLLLVTIISTLIFSCKDDGPSEPDLTPQQQQSQKLKTTWVTKSFVAPDGVEDDYSNFRITFNTNDASTTGGGSFSTTNGGALFASSGSWSFNGTSTSQISISQNNAAATGITILSVNDSQLRMEVNAPDPNQRVESIFGKYTFTMEKQ